MDHANNEYWELITTIRHTKTRLQEERETLDKAEDEVKDTLSRQEVSHSSIINMSHCNQSST